MPLFLTSKFYQCPVDSRLRPLLNQRALTSKNDILNIIVNKNVDINLAN